MKVQLDIQTANRYHSIEQIKRQMCHVTDNEISKLCSGRQLKHRNKCIEIDGNWQT